MRYACIDRRRNQYPVRIMCRLLQVSHSGYYAWRVRPESHRARTDRELIARIRQIHADSDGVYGAVKICAELNEQGYPCGRHKVARLMRQAGLRGCPKPKFTVTTQRDPSHPVADNLLEQDFTAAGPNERWASDITYISTQQGWLYLAVVMDLYSRAIVGWSMSRRMTQQLVCDALTMALFRRHFPKGTIIHSDRGSQYCSKRYQRLIKTNGLHCSMGRRANCYDNAAMESFFHTLKVEHVHRERYVNRRTAKSRIFEYIETYYNRQRKHSAIGYKIPMLFEQAA